MTTDNPLLNSIKASVEGRSPAELLQLRRDIARHIRDLEPYIAAEDGGGVGELTRRFGADARSSHYPSMSAEGQRKRLERHRAEIKYLDELLQAPDPILAAQAAAS